MQGVLHRRVINVIALASLTLTSLMVSVSMANEISSTNPATGKWSDPKIWQGGTVPGVNDTANLANSAKLTYDIGAPEKIGKASCWSSASLTLEKDLQAQGLYLREGTIVDGGHNLTVGILSNYTANGDEGNGGTRKGQGGNLSIGDLVLGRFSFYTFYPGDTISGKYTTTRIRSSWPDITVTQDTSFYGNRLDRGLSFDGATSTVTFGRTSGTDQAEITLNWDSGMTGTIDWTLRWKGNHVSELKGYYDKGQIKVGSLPNGRSFDPARNIFFDDATGYTYIGFSAG